MMHMLYHVPEPARAVAEAARVLRPGGVLLVATNSRRHLAEMNELSAPAAGPGAPCERRSRTPGSWTALVTADETRRFVAMQFGDPDEHWLRSSVVVTDPAPVVRHAASTIAARAVGEHHDELVHEFEDAISARIRRDGQFTITTEVAFLAATKA